MAKSGLRGIREIVLRARWTVEDARTIFAAWNESKLPATEFAGEHGFDAQRLYWWRRRFGAQSISNEGQKVFEEVLVQPEARVVEPEDPRLEIVFAHGLAVRVPSSFDEPALRRLLKIVGEVGAC